MKRFLFIPMMFTLLMYSCGGVEESNETVEDEPNVELPYEQGGAEDPKAYFEGLAGHLNRVDEKLRYVRELDDLNASADSINTELDSILTLTAEDKKIVMMYDDKDWPEKDSLQKLTMSWYDAVEMLVNDHFVNLAEPMSRPDESWTEEDKELYHQFEAAYFDIFFVTDQNWIGFQDVFTEANNLKFNEEEPDL